VEARRISWFDDRGLIVGGVGERHVPFYAGAMHYWRVPPAHWRACLRQMHAQGLTLVETYVPWRVHEPERGTRAWTGERDLGAFLDAARTAGLGVVLRPGPHINAELTSFGMPDWVLAEPACQARTAQGTPAWLPAPPRAFPIPSYASAAFRAHVRAWYAQVAEVVRPFVGDPVVAIGVDNEAQMFFRAGAYDLDYHPDAIAWFGPERGDPPRAWSDAQTCVPWLKFQDEYLARALGEFAAMLDDVGLGGLARFHNLPPGHYQLSPLGAIQRAIAGPVGIDAYTSRAQFRELRWRAAALVGKAAPLPLALEVGVGFFPWFPPLDAADDPTRERDHLLTLLAAGVRGFNLYMAVDRDRWYGGAIDARGRLEPHAKWIHPLLAALAEVDWPSLRRTAPIALVDTRADWRVGLASSALPMTPVVAEAIGLGPGGAAELGLDSAAITSRRWQTAVCRALELAQVPFAIVDEHVSASELAKYRAVIAPTLDRVDARLWATLHELAKTPLPAEARPTIVVIGPGTPTRDECDRPLAAPGPKRAGRLKADSLDDLPGLAADLAALAELGDAWQIERPDDVRATPFHAPDGTTRVVFVTSDAARTVAATLLVADGVRGLRDPLSSEHVRVERGRATIAMAPHGVRMFVVA